MQGTFGFLSVPWLFSDYLRSWGLSSLTPQVGRDVVAAQQVAGLNPGATLRSAAARLPARRRSGMVFMVCSNPLVLDWRSHVKGIEQLPTATFQPLL